MMVLAGRRWAFQLFLAAWPSPFLIAAAAGSLVHDLIRGSHATMIAEALTLNFGVYYVAVLLPFVACRRPPLLGSACATVVASAVVGSWFVLPHHGGWGLNWNQMLQAPGILLQHYLSQILPGLGLA